VTRDDKPKSSGRSLSESDRSLWSHVIRSVVPLRRRPGAAAQTETTHSAEMPTRGSERPVKRAAPAAAPAKPSPPPPSLAPIDRRTRQRLKRGTDPIEARIDLHGMTLAQAHRALVRFLHASQAQGVKFVLVITGKGGTSGERGALRREVPHWLARGELRGTVLGFDAAHIGHGGDGALYVRLRRLRKSRSDGD
jgi:DNA-nicking Smr family endonuclease